MEPPTRDLHHQFTPPNAESDRPRPVAPTRTPPATDTADAVGANDVEHA